MYIFRDARAELVHTRILLHIADILADEQHGISSVGLKRMDVFLRLAGAPVYHSDEIIGYDEAVFCLLLVALGLDALFYYLHKRVASYY